MPHVEDLRAEYESLSRSAASFDRTTRDRLKEGDEGRKQFIKHRAKERAALLARKLDVFKRLAEAEKAKAADDAAEAVARDALGLSETPAVEPAEVPPPLAEEGGQGANSEGAAPPAGTPSQSAEQSGQVAGVEGPAPEENKSPEPIVEQAVEETSVGEPPAVSEPQPAQGSGGVGSGRGRAGGGGRGRR